MDVNACHYFKKTLQHEKILFFFKKHEIEKREHLFFIAITLCYLITIFRKWQHCFSEIKLL